MSPVVTAFKNDLKAAKKMRLPWWGVLSWMAGCLPIVLLLDHFGRLNLALPILNGIGTLGFLIALKWKLRRYAWFWMTMIIIAVLHIPLIVFIPWTTKWVPAVAITAIDSADVCIILAILALIGKFIKGPKTSEG